MQEALEESVQMMKEAVDDLGATLAEAASAAGAVGGMVDSINDAINKMEDSPALEPEGTFVDYQTTMVKTAKAIAVTVQEMVRPFQKSSNRNYCSGDKSKIWQTETWAE